MGYAIVAPLPRYAPLISLRKLITMPITDVGGFLSSHLRIHTHTHIHILRPRSMPLRSLPRPCSHIGWVWQVRPRSSTIGRIVNELKDEAEPYHKMVMEMIMKVIASLGTSNVDEKLEVRLVDGIIYSFQEQTTEDQVLLDRFGMVFNALGIRVKPYLMQIVLTILWQRNNKSAKVRQQAADLTTHLAVVIKQCGED